MKKWLIEYALLVYSPSGARDIFRYPSRRRFTLRRYFPLSFETPVHPEEIFSVVLRDATSSLLRTNGKYRLEGRRSSGRTEKYRLEGRRSSGRTEKYRLEERYPSGLTRKIRHIHQETRTLLTPSDKFPFVPPWVPQFLPNIPPLCLPN